MADELPDTAIRAGDDERERTVSLLRRHAAEGRLDVEELDERVQAAYGARTRGDLGALTRDLPAIRPAARPEPRPDAAGVVALERQVVSSVVLLVFLTGIWAASGGGYFWPVWPALGLGLAVCLHAAKVFWADPDERER